MGLLNRLFRKNTREGSQDESKEKKVASQEEASLYKFDGLKAMRMGNIPLALMFLEKAMEIFPEFETRYYYANTLRRSDKPQDALAQYDLLLKEVPSHYTALTERASLLLQQDDAEAALKDAQLALENSESDEEKALSLRLLSRIQVSLTCYPEAIENAEKALELDPQDTTSALSKTRALTLLGKNEEALQCIQEARKLFPEEERFLLYEASIHEREGNADDATRIYQETLEIDPFNEEAALGLVRIMLSSSQLAEALTFMESFKSDRKVSNNILRAYVDLLSKNEKEEEASAVISTLEEDATVSTADFSNLYQGGIF